MSDRHAFLAALHDDGWRDFRAIASGHEPRQRFFRVEDLASADAEFLDARYNEHASLFVGVACRTQGHDGSLDGCGRLNALFADLDFKDTTEADARARLAAFPIPPSIVVHSGNGLHPYWLLVRALEMQNPSDREQAKRLLKALRLALAGDPKSAEPARVLRVPGTLNHKYNPPRPVVLEHIDTTHRVSVETMAEALADHLATEQPSRSTPTTLAATLALGRRNDDLFREGSRLRRHGYTEPEVLATLEALNRERGAPPLPPGEVATIARSCMRYDPAADTFPLTEAGDAEFFAALYADDVRYDHRRGRWLLYKGHRWVPQSTGDVNRLALDAVRARQTAALKVDEQERRQKHLKWAIAGEARKRQSNLLALAQNLPPLADAGDDWDTDPWLLCVENGVVDLRTGTLRNGRPEDRITMQASVTFDPAAQSPLWDRTVAEIFAGDADLIAYFDRYVGYSLTGDCREETLALCWGDGANGKGTLMNTLGWLLADYADDLPFSALELHRNGNGSTNDIAKLVGKRFVTSSESGETRRLNEARVKALTGRDPITARFLFREFFTFQPVAKFWLATNHKPVVEDQSTGFWRRLHLIPFTQSFEGNPNRELKTLLRAEGPGILARAVRGCLEWQRMGLQPPQTVVDATNDYRMANMPLVEFFEECCVLGDAMHATAGALFKAYKKWASDNDVPAWEQRTKPKFEALLHARFKSGKVDQRVTFFGVGLKTTMHEAGPMQEEFDPERTM